MTEFTFRTVRNATAPVTVNRWAETPEERVRWAAAHTFQDLHAAVVTGAWDEANRLAGAF